MAGRKEQALHVAPALIEVAIIILLALNLKIVYDAHHLAQDHQDLTSRIASIVKKQIDTDIATCYMNVPRGVEARQLIVYANSFSKNKEAVRAFRDYLARTEASMPTWAECDALAVTLKQGRR